ncbi:diguanylate cyclase (GGDEF)-like protein [Xanthomonas sp. JAI131]|jgi:diguanylate cyclase (GGDEF)-like protein|uniref:GGDEF domain-containing protein n=1 Tax=unclassified Xanthomonas TaxID=2643310 RepID=UPI0015CB6CD1|nr:GGDEF domain-containing protein [Xanthomonas sp. JAI131]NYF20668.1 diguanylate cyclase (GGDEF)-like protein [Xanthomonas sp. JAI131]
MLDIETLYFSSTVSRAAFLVIFVVTVLSRPKERYLHHWTVALLASTFGSLLTITRHGDALPPLMALLVYTLFISSLALSWSGMRLFYGRTVSVRTLLLLSVLPSALYAAAAVAGVTERITLPFIYFSAALPAALVLYEILIAPDRRLLSQYVVALAFGCYFLTLAVPAALMTFGLVLDIRKSERIPIIFDQASSILVYFGYIAMAGERANLGLKRQAESDPLTNLANRRGGRRMLERLHARLASGRRCSVLLADVDYFKHVNDGFGHDVGDAVLVSIAQRLSGGLRKRDEAVRWGGEEFLVVLPDTGIDDAENSAERLRALMEAEPFKVEGRQLAITLSLGVAEMDPADLSFDAVILRADRALYRAKREGRNRVCRSAGPLE